MRLPRVRFTIKRMLLAIAVLALLMFGVRMAWLSTVYRRAAARHRNREAVLREIVRLMRDNEEKANEIFGRTLTPEEKAQQTSRNQSDDAGIEYYSQMRRKYDRAAARPWLAVEPDPPWPEP
jgi:hypothetical protein